MANQFLLGSDAHEWGTVNVASTYGTVLSSDLEEKVAEHVFENNVGDAAAVLLHNHEIEVTLTVLFTDTATALAIGDQLTFPLSGTVKGNVTSIKDSRKNKDGRQITFTAKHWKSMGNQVASVV